MSTFQIQSSEVLARLKPFGISFEKSLSDLIKGIRAHSKELPESLLTFLDNAIQECKDELATTDLEAKATAVLKLAYLEMYGFDMSWCNFQILEVMSSAKFQQKRIGYLAAMQSFKNEQDLLILATNQFKKDLNSHNHVEIGLALSGIATIVTSALAIDIVDDVVMKLTHSKPYIRKKAVLALFKIFLQYPEALRPSLPRIIEKLDDPDIAVVSSTITVICEISKTNPTIFISYLPKFFDIMEDTTNNWLIIRLLKLFQSLLKIEPRMKKRILPSILNLMDKTQATSLIFECINCIVSGGMISAGSAKDQQVAKKCTEQLLNFFRGDANLDFVALSALTNILKIYPQFMHEVPGVANIIMAHLKVSDTIIKRKALEFCQLLVTEDNMAQLVKTLLLQLVPSKQNAPIPESLKLEIAARILEVASKNNYAYIPNFKWYVTALKELVNLTLLPTESDASGPSLSKATSAAIATKVGNEFRSVAIKVPSIRPFLIKRVVVEYANDTIPLKYCPILMKELYWIMGEYIGTLDLESNDGEDEDEDELNFAEGHTSVRALSVKVQLFNNLVNASVDEKLRNGTQFPISKLIVELQEAEVLSALIDAIVKLFSAIISDYEKLYLNYGKFPYDKFCQIGYFLLKLIRFLEHWEYSSSYEVQERCLSWLEFFKLCIEAIREHDVSGIDALEKNELESYAKLAKEKASSSDTEDEESDSYDEGESDEESSDGSEDESADEAGEAEQSSDGADSGSVVASSEQIAHASFDGELPVLLSRVLPSFFKSYELNPVSVTAQRHIHVPEDLDIDTELNAVPLFCLTASNPPSEDDLSSSDDDEEASSEVPAFDPVAAKERKERLEDDPYYITTSKKKGAKSAKKKFAIEDDSKASGSEVSSEKGFLIDLSDKTVEKPKKSRKMKKEKVMILSEETFGDDSEVVQPASEARKKKKSNLIIDTLNLGNLDLSQSEQDALASNFEYDVDIDALRTQLAEQATVKATKDKKKKVKKTKNSTTKVKEEPQPHVADASVEPSISESKETVDTGDENHITHVPTKSKKKKKKKAVIHE